MGATRGVHVTDPALAGLLRGVHGHGPRRRAQGARVRPRPGRRRHVRRRRRHGRRRPSRRASACRSCRTPHGSSPTSRPRTVRVRRISATGYDLLEAPMPALISCTQALGEPRYPSLKGIMAARSKEIATRIAGRPRARSVGGRRRPSARPRCSTRSLPPARGVTEVVRGAGGRGRHAHRRVPHPAADRLMGELWVIGEPGPDGGLARISTEVATLARDLGAASGRDVVGIVVDGRPRGGRRGAGAVRAAGRRDRGRDRRRSRLVGAGGDARRATSSTPPARRPTSSWSVPAPTVVTSPAPSPR